MPSQAFQYWIDADGDSKRQTSEVITKNLSANGALLLDNSSFKSLRLITEFEVQLNLTNRNVVWLFGEWDFRTNKALFSNSSLSPDLDVVKWAWFYPDPKSTVVEIALFDEDLFHKLRAGTPTESISHGLGVLVGRPTELLNEVIAMLQGKKGTTQQSSPPAPPQPQQSSPTISLDLLTLSMLILIPIATVLAAITTIKLRQHIRRKRLIKTGWT